MPKKREVKPLREEPKPPNNPFDGGKTRDDLINEEFKGFMEHVEKPEKKPSTKMFS